MGEGELSKHVVLICPFLRRVCEKMEQQKKRALFIIFLVCFLLGFDNLGLGR